MEARERLVLEVSRTVRDQRVLDAIASVPRELFVDVEDKRWAYRDMPLSIGFGQTISQPTMIGIMLEALELTGEEHVLEVGAGSGYQAALLSKLCRTVVSTEVIPELVARAQSALREAGISNVEVLHTPGELGAADRGPYDAVIVAAAAPSIPEPLVDQVTVGGILAVPVGSRHAQELVVARRTEHGLTVTYRGGCRFVPLVGEHGFGGER